jgi:hypothetical protein
MGMVGDIYLQYVTRMREGDDHWGRFRVMLDIKPTRKTIKLTRKTMGLLGFNDAWTATDVSLRLIESCVQILANPTLKQFHET